MSSGSGIRSTKRISEAESLRNAHDGSGAGSILVNDTEITEDAINREMQYHPAASREEAQAEAARALAIRELLIQEARRRGLGADEDEAEGRATRGGPNATAAEGAEDEALIAKLIEEEVQVPTVSEEECRRFYENNRERFRTSDSFEAAHIFFPAPRDDPDARRQAREQAWLACRELSRPDDGQDRFAELARERSECSSAPDGGYLGWITLGQTAPEIEKELYSMSPGDIGQRPVETKYGCHVLYLMDFRKGEYVSFEQAQPAIARYLQDQWRNHAIRQLIRLLAGTHRVRGIDLEGTRAPLVQ